MLRLRLACMFKMFSKGGVVTWVWVVLSVLNTKCFIRCMRYYIAFGLTYERVYISTCQIDLCIIIIYTWNFAVGRLVFFRGAFPFSTPHRQTRAKSMRVPFNSKQYVWIVGGERSFSFIYWDMKMCSVGFERHHNMDIVARVYNFLSGILW